MILRMWTVLSVEGNQDGPGASAEYANRDPVPQLAE